MFDMAGGRLKSASWGQIRDAEKRIAAVVPELMPVDDQFPERLRAVAWRAQPHILDEAIMSLFDRDDDDLEEGEEPLDQVECVKLFFLVWVAVEVLDANWKPPKNFQGEADYTYKHIEPEKKEDSESTEE